MSASGMIFVPAGMMANPPIESPMLSTRLRMPVERNGVLQSHSNHIAIT